MALVLEIKKGEGFWVGEYPDGKRITVEEIYSLSRFQVMVHGPVSNMMEIGNKFKTEVLPGVFCQAGRDQPSTDGFSCKITITAPSSELILRDELYERSKSS